MSGDEADATGAGRPVLRVVSGEPAPEELAALLAVVAARAGCGGEPAPAAPPSRWASPASRLRRPLPTGPGAWRASGLPGL